MTLQPTSLKMLDDRRLLITWSDGNRRQYEISELREYCPCATCREKKNAKPPQPALGSLPILSPAEAQPLRIESMRPVGAYAYGIQFSDGHNTGIYTFQHLLTLGEPVAD